MSNISVTLVGDTKLKERLQNMAERANNPAYAMKLIANAMRRDVMDHFDQERGPRGQWKDLKTSTWKWKTEHGYRNMLQNTGMLRRRCVPESGSDYAAVVNDLKYAGAQNYGDTNLPAREFLWISANALKGIMQLLQGYIVEGM